jgi:hypothetical protein
MTGDKAGALRERTTSLADRNAWAEPVIRLSGWRRKTQEELEQEQGDVERHGGWQEPRPRLSGWAAPREEENRQKS